MNMEGLDFVTLYLALTPSQAEAVLNGLGECHRKVHNVLDYGPIRLQPYSAVSISMNGKLGMAPVRILV